MTPQAFLDGYLSKKAGVLDTLHAQVRKLGRLGGTPKMPATNFGALPPPTSSPGQQPAATPAAPQPAGKDGFGNVVNYHRNLQEALKE